MRCDVTYEELSRLVAGELADGAGGRDERARTVEEHASSCARCRERIDALRELDAALGSLPREAPPARAALETRRAVSRELETGAREIMTLDEVADLLRVTREELEEAPALPAFEIAGQVRVRRTRLVEWLEERERAYVRSNVESDVARILLGDFGKGVA